MEDIFKHILREYIFNQNAAFEALTVFQCEKNPQIFK